MRTTLFAVFLTAALTFPVAWAGSSEDPEATDPAGDAPGPLDITAGWLSTPSNHRVTITFQLADLGDVVAPAADSDDTIRYYYHVDLSASSYGARAFAECVVSIADYSVSGVLRGGSVTSPLLSFYGAHVGTRCHSYPFASSENAFNVTGSPYPETDRFVMTLGTNKASLGEGVSLTNVELTTWQGKAATTGGGNHRAPVASDYAAAGNYVVGS